MTISIYENPTIKLLLDAGFNTGWVVTGEALTLWEHDENPPAPLKKPTNEK